MRKIIILIPVMLQVFSIYAQEGVGFLGGTKAHENVSAEQLKLLQSQDQLQSANLQLQILQQRQILLLSRQVHTSQDSARQAPDEQAQALDLQQQIKALNEQIAQAEQRIEDLFTSINTMKTAMLSKTPVEANIRDSIKKWGFYGIGNLNTESFNNVNASGKIAGFFRPYRGAFSFTTVNFSYNRNASNNDSLLVSTFLFPDVGIHSLSFSVEHAILLNRVEKDGGFHMFSPFVEFSLKNISGRQADSTRNFTTLNYVAGGKYTYWLKSGDDNFYFSASVFLARNHVPSKFDKDYKYLFGTDTLANNIFSAGVKMSVQYNQFQVFADLRNVFGSKQDIHVEALRGFNYTIGFIFNAQFIER